MTRQTAPTRAEKLELHENTVWRMQEEILRANPLKNIIALASGQGIPGIPAPTTVQVESANYALLRRIMPELKSITVKTDPRGSGDDGRAFVRELAEFIGQVAAIKAGGGTIPPLLDLASTRQPASSGD